MAKATHKPIFEIMSTKKFYEVTFISAHPRRIFDRKSRAMAYAKRIASHYNTMGRAYTYDYNGECYGCVNVL